MIDEILYGTKKEISFTFDSHFLEEKITQDILKEQSKIYQTGMKEQIPILKRKE